MTTKPKRIQAKQKKQAPCMDRTKERKFIDNFESAVAEEKEEEKERQEVLNGITDMWRVDCVTDLSPIKLRDLKKRPKEELIQIILLREIKFNDLAKEWHEAAKKDRVSSFLLSKMKDMKDFAYYAVLQEFLDKLIKKYSLNKIKKILGMEIKFCRKCTKPIIVPGARVYCISYCVMCEGHFMK